MNDRVNIEAIEAVETPKTMEESIAYAAKLEGLTVEQWHAREDERHIRLGEWNYFKFIFHAPDYAKAVDVLKSLLIGEAYKITMKPRPYASGKFGHVEVTVERPDGWMPERTAESVKADAEMIKQLHAAHVRLNSDELEHQGYHAALFFADFGDDKGGGELSENAHVWGVPRWNRVEL